MLRRLSGPRSPPPLTEAELAKAKEVRELIDKSLEVGDKSAIGQGHLTPENIRLLSRDNKLRFRDMIGTYVKAPELDTTVVRMKSDDGSIVFCVERDDALTIGVKVLETLRCIGVDEAVVSIVHAHSRSREGELNIGAQSALTLVVSGSLDTTSTRLFRNRGCTPSNVVPSRAQLDHEFVRRYRFDQFVQETCDSYDAFISGKAESLDAREEMRAMDLVVESFLTGKAGAETDGGVKVGASASNKTLVEARLEFSAKFLSDKHPGLLAKRKAEETRKKDEKDKKTASEKHAEDEARRLKAEKEFEAMEARCQDNLDTVYAGYQMEMNNALEKISNPSSWKWFWEANGPVEKKIFVVGVREAGKSTLVWLMSTLTGRTWEKMDDDVNAKATRHPLGEAEASTAVTRVPLNVLLPSKKVATFAVDIQGEQQQVREYRSGDPDQLIVVVVPAADLFTHKGELVHKFDDKLKLLPYIKDAAAIVVTKWDELKYGIASRSSEIFTNVDQFWTDAECVAFSKACIAKLTAKTQTRAFAFRMPIREEGSKRSYQARYQMCCGVKEVLLFLIRKME